MTAPRPRRQRTRTRRPGRPKRPDPRQPSQAYRLAHGPQVPEAVIENLRAALEAELRGRVDAESPPPAPPLSERWRQALAAAAAAISALALAGVGRALGTVPDVPITEEPSMEEWMEQVDTDVRRSLAETARAGVLALLLGRAMAIVESAVLARHSTMVAVYARAAGSPGYIWTTQLDGVVRSLHQELEGTTQSWADPPVSGSGGWRGHPGEPAMCRCVPFPLHPQKSRGRVARSN